MDLAKGAFHFSLVGIQGNDIVVGNGKLALALFWQQMRYSLLGTVAALKSSLGGSGGAASDEDILRWANPNPNPNPHPNSNPNPNPNPP